MEEKREDKRSILVCEILRYAQANARGDLSLAVLSRRFGYSREHLSRLLHTYLRENWNHYVNRPSRFTGRTPAPRKHRQKCT